MKSMRRLFVIALLLLATACGGGGAPEAKATISVAATSVGGAMQTTVPTTQAATGTAVGGAQSLASPSPATARSPSPSPVTTTSDVVTAPSGVTVKITSPAPNASVPAGTLRVTYDVIGATLVPAAEARRVEDLHIHVLLDVDPTPYLGTTTSIPTGNPNIVHTAAREAAFNDVRPGQHRVTIILSGANHVSLRPPVSDSVTFTVQ